MIAIFFLPGLGYILTDILIHIIGSNCVFRPLSPLCDPDASEYVYRSRIINYIWEALFFDVNVIAIMKA